MSALASGAGKLTLTLPYPPPMPLNEAISIQSDTLFMLPLNQQNRANKGTDNGSADLYRCSLSPSAHLDQFKLVMSTMFKNSWPNVLCYNFIPIEHKSPHFTTTCDRREEPEKTFH